MKTHIVHFFILLGILGIGVVAFFSAAGNSGVQLAIGVVTSVAYVVWGILHHATQGVLHKKIVVEYVLIAAIAILLLEIVLGP